MGMTGVLGGSSSRRAGATAAPPSVGALMLAAADFAGAQLPVGRLRHQCVHGRFIPCANDGMVRAISASAHPLGKRALAWPWKKRLI